MEEKKEIRERNPYIYDFEKLPDSEWSSIGIVILKSWKDICNRCCKNNF